jgi:hypothetical protein
MCTMIAKKIAVEGSGKGTSGWFSINQANVSYDHPFHIGQEHALSIDFVNEGLGLDARVAVELSEADARQLVAAIVDVLEQAREGGHLDFYGSYRADRLRGNLLWARHDVCTVWELAGLRTQERSCPAPTSWIAAALPFASY